MTPFSKRGKMKKYIAGILLIHMLSAQTAVASANNINEPSDWAKADVTKAAGQDLVPASLMNQYQQSITRGELSQVLVRLYERLSGKKIPVPDVSPFRDTKDEDVLKAYAIGIVKGTGEQRFEPKERVTREELAVMLDLVLQKAGLSVSLKGGSVIRFSDAGSISSWAKEAAVKLAKEGILQGTVLKDEILFRPQDHASREQIYSLAFRILDQYGKGTVRVSNKQDPGSKKIYDEAVRIVDKLIKPGMSEMEKELAIHDYIVLHTAYDYDNYLKNTVPSESYSAYGVFFNGTAVCEGYAEAAHLLLELAGIESQIVTGYGNGGAHAWNKVKIDGAYYNLDVTWDDPVPDKEGRIVYSYFNITDKELALNHSWDTTKWPAATETKYDYYEYKGLALHSAAELKTRIHTAIANRETGLKFKTAYEGSKLSDVLAALSGHSNLGYSYTYSGKAFSIEFKYL